ncbi:MAG: TlpA family protein disulfide reductase [Verrucomicrobia bacterium]|nr:TlpA family protein disulfide reductase [Verrucomicrobiota bacterium]
MSFFDLATGQGFETKSLRGNLVLLNLWAAWSPSSAKELPELVILQQKFSGKGLLVLGVCLDDAPPAGLLVFAERHGIRYPLVRPGDSTLDRLNPIETIPYTLLLDPEGKILHRFRGPFKPSEVREAIEKYL